jgi:hypothetical protein
MNRALASARDLVVEAIVLFTVLRSGELRGSASAASKGVCP